PSRSGPSATASSKPPALDGHRSGPRHGSQGRQSYLGSTRSPNLSNLVVSFRLRHDSRAALEQTRLEVVDSSKAQLLVVVNHAWDEEKRDKVALLTFVELHIPGVELHIPGELGVASSSDPSVRRVIVVWRDRNLELVPTADAHEAILNSLASSLERFNWARRTANGGDNDD
ncbi:MAG: hypothetical protein ACRDHF_07230, partial [Tepidiformaceae bacterium]